MIAFYYDYANQRVKKGNTFYIGKLYECTIGVCTKHIFANGQRIASKKSTGQTYYYHTDHLGSSNVITDQNANKVEEIYYYPFGGTRTDTGSVNIPYKYTDQGLDSETGLYDYNARMYDPAIGRFISADMIVPDFSNPQSLNRYSYVLNNPLRYTDPDGHWVFLALMAAGAIIGGTHGDVFNANAWEHFDLGGAAMGAAIGAGLGYSAPFVASAGWGSVAPSAVGWGAATGGAIGGYSAYMQGGNVLQGIAFGAVLGAGAGALCSALPVIGSSTAGQLGFWGSVGQGAAFGAIQGTAFGASIGYGGGAGDLNDILKSAAYGAIAGAATGAILGGFKYAYQDNYFIKADQPRLQNFGGTSVDAENATRAANMSDVTSAVGKAINFGGSKTPTGTWFNFNIFGTPYQGGLTIAGSDAYLYNSYLQQKLNVNLSITY